MSNMTTNQDPARLGFVRLDGEPSESSPASGAGSSEPIGGPSKPGERGAPGPSTEALQAAREAILDPREQLRSAVALQIGQLNELVNVLARFQDLMEATGTEWRGWIERSMQAQEATERSLDGLSRAKGDQEELLRGLRAGWISARDEDTARLESGLRNLAAATDMVCGTGTRFAVQVQDGLQILERRLPEVAGQVSATWEQSIQRLQGRLHALTWIGAGLGILVAADILARVLK